MSGRAVADATARPDGDRRPGLIGRLFSLHVGAMLMRNTIVSCSVFGLGLILLWALVDIAHIDKIVAAGAGFILANSLHYLIGRAWIFRGTQRGVKSGYIYFLLNSGIGLLATMGLYALLLPLMPMHYLLVRSIVSLFAGLIVFVLNAALNFRKV